MKSRILAVLLLLLSAPYLTGQTTDWKFSGQLQLRSELDGRDFSNRTHPLTFSSLRTRVGVEKGFENLNFFVQIQDSRVFGEEQNTQLNLKNLDLHQGYVILSDLFELPFSLQAGRFEVAYGTERFLGAVGWNYIGRAWDGVRLKIKSDFSFDLFALTQIENQGYIGNPQPGTYFFPDLGIPSSSLYGFWSAFALQDLGELDPFFYYDINRAKINGESSVSRYTAGINYFYRHPVLSIIFEGAYQGGKVSAKDVSAYLLSLQLLHNHAPFNFAAGGDILSGNSPKSEKTGAFTTPYATNHKFYGFMDFFISIPTNTNGLGLHDFYINAGLKPDDSKFSGNIWLHYFASNQKLVEETSFGQELDMTLSYNFVKGTTLSWGGSLFFPGELMKTFFRTVAGNREDTAFWTYVMISAGI